MITPMASRVVLTYGAFDHFHQGHVKFLKRLSMLGTELIVGCTTDAYAEQTGLAVRTSYGQRRLMLESCRYVSRVIAEQDDAQKQSDIVNYNVSVFAMGEECTGQFDHFENLTQVVYLPRAEIIGSRRPFHAVPQPSFRLAAGH